MSIFIICFLISFALVIECIFWSEIIFGTVVPFKSVVILTVSAFVILLPKLSSLVEKYLYNL